MELEKLKRAENELDQKLSVYPPKMVEKTPVQEILSRISLKIPPNITLTSFSLNMDAITEEKAAESKSAPAQEKAPKPAAAPRNGPKPKGEGTIQLKGWFTDPATRCCDRLDAFSRGLETVNYFSGVRLEDVKKNDTFKTPAADFSLSFRMSF